MTSPIHSDDSEGLSTGTGWIRRRERPAIVTVAAAIPKNAAVARLTTCGARAARYEATRKTDTNKIWAR